MAAHRIPDIGARQLEAVLAVAENRSFVAAAAQLRVSQPALTRTVKRVEDVLGLRLFERTTRVVRLTEAGREFVAVARRVADDLRIAAESMRELAEERRGQVIVSAITSVADGVLPEAVTAYRRARPGVEIRVRDGVHGSVIDDVKSGAADFGLTYLQDVPDGLSATRLGRGRFMLVASPGAAIAAAADERGAVRFDDLRGEPLVSMPPESQTRRVLDAVAAVRGVSLTHAVGVAQISTLLAFVRAGVGVGLAPAASLSGSLGAGLLRFELRDPDLALDIGLLRLTDRTPSPAAEGLREVIEQRWPEH
ncbi:MAG: LysR substrate-binding domain-containing protein [Pseudomonadota bacterium]